MIKYPKAINFYQGKICIRHEDGTLTFEDDSCIPIIKEKIDKYIENNTNILSVKDIIYCVIKEHFNITKVFKLPNEKSYISNNDTLYIELVSHITNNPIYSLRLSKSNINHLDKKDVAYHNQNRRNDLAYGSYIKQKHNMYIKKIRNHKY